MTWNRIAPLTGVVFFILAVLSFIVGGDDIPEAGDAGRDVIEFYVDDEDAQIFSAILGAWATVFFIFFIGTLRRVLRRAEGSTGSGLSATAFGGGILVAVGLAIFGAIGFTLADTADEISPETAATLAAMNEDFFFPAAIGISVFMFATGLAVIRNGGLPVWLGWIAALLGIVAVTPIGFAAFLGMGIWVLVASIVLAMGADEPAGAAGAPGAGAPAPPPGG